MMWSLLSTVRQTLQSLWFWIRPSVTWPSLLIGEVFNPPFHLLCPDGSMLLLHLMCAALPSAAPCSPHLPSILPRPVSSVPMGGEIFIPCKWISDYYQGMDISRQNLNPCCYIDALLIFQIIVCNNIFGLFQSCLTEKKLLLTFYFNYQQPPTHIPTAANHSLICFFCVVVAV